MPRNIKHLQSGITERQLELQRVADILAKEAHLLGRRGGLSRVVLIALGATSAAQAGIEKLAIVPEPYFGLFFLATGILVAVIAGVEAAFKFESKGAELTALAASCHSMVRQTDAAWYRQVVSEEDSEKQVQGTLQVMELQQSKLDEVQEKAAALGVNIALEVRRRYNKTLPSSGDDDDDDDDDDPRRPYAA